ncbi:hypothetical protein [Piscirickettsia litoralis]|uniref:Uncharacterized protein n=1 Tax=Piscirickettsia litoralis TaxID=1891921 RepID=A0ABX3A7V1_9GAMM|nr:hypothetical protein [Piscirickettsia litoralis]ODN42179.1 hypothetical protein BGC07_03495 [Piscirickettsia litoralis]
MEILLYFIGLLILSIAISGAIKPYLVDALIDRHGIGKAYWLAIAARIVFGVIFLLGAEATRWPSFFFVMGWLLIIIAIILYGVRLERFRKIVLWWEKINSFWQRVWFVILGIFSLFVIFSI